MNGEFVAAEVSGCCGNELVNLVIVRTPPNMRMIRS